MRVSRSHSLTAFVAVALSVASCDDPNGPPAPGAIRVVVTTNGEDIIATGLRVSVVNGPTRQLGPPGGLEIIILGMTPGVHMLQLDGLAVNCQVASANPRSVTVVSNDTTTAEFHMFCVARTGSVRVTTATTGAELDADGYTAMVIGGPARVVPANGTGTIGNVREGERMVTLGGVAPNCEIAGADTITVMVALGATADVAFSVQCQLSGSLEVTVSTTGLNPDPNGYVVAVQATSVNFAGTLDIAPNGSVTFSSLRPAADYRVTLEHVAANCDVVGAAVQTVTVTAGSTTRVAIEVACLAPAPLAFVRDDDIYAITPSSGIDGTRLTTDPAFDGDPAWSSTGQIAFTTTRHSNDAELYVMNADGTNPVRLTTSSDVDDNPSWSPDGRKIVFRSLRDGNSELFIVNADGSGLTRLTNNTVSDLHPAWSSTGKLAFVSDRDHSAGEIYVMNEDGSNIVRLTNNDAAEANPAWSPDGSMIAFARTIDCYYYCTQDLFVVNADGSNERRLATAEGTDLYRADPSWSPTGRSIAYTEQHCPYYCDPPSVALVDVDGTRRALITTNGSNPAWKP